MLITLDQHLIKLCIQLLSKFFIDSDFLIIIGLNNILFEVLLTYYDIYIHTIFLGFDGKR